MFSRVKSQNKETEDWISTSNGEEHMKTEVYTDTTLEGTLEGALQDTIEDIMTCTPAEADIVNKNTQRDDSDTESSDGGDPMLKELFLSSESYNLLEQNFIINENSTVFVVLQDDVPQFYVQNLTEARNYMWTLARFYKFNLLTNYTSYIKEGDDQNQLKLMGSYRFFLFPYDRVISYFEISEIKEVDKLKSC